MAKKPLRDLTPKGKQDYKGVKKSSVEAGATGKDPGVDYDPKPKAEQDFVSAHKTEKHDDRVGNGDDVYNASKVKYSMDDKRMKFFGHKRGKDESVYESKSMKCESCGKMYEGAKCECGWMPKSKKQKLLLGGKKLDEVITKKTPTSKVIDDFVHSKNPKFAGKSKEERIRMALGAKYSMMRKEDIDEAKANYDDTPEEVSMVTTELRAIIAKSEELLKKMPMDMHIEPWVQSKVAMAKASIGSIHDYILYKDVKEGIQNYPGSPMLEDGVKIKKGKKVKKEEAPPADTQMKLNPPVPSAYGASNSPDGDGRV
jgi:hypothetical protein